MARHSCGLHICLLALAASKGMAIDCAAGDCAAGGAGDSTVLVQMSKTKKATGHEEGVLLQAGKHNLTGSAGESVNSEVSDSPWCFFKSCKERKKMCRAGKCCNAMKWCGHGKGSKKSSMKKVVFIQDACLDDFLAIAALARAHKDKEIEWLGDIVVNADSVLPQSMDMTYQFHQALGVSDVPVSISKSRLFNAFPWTYRNDTWSLAQLDSMKDLANQYNAIWTSYEQYPDGDEFLEKLLEEAEDDSVTILTVATQTILEPIFKKSPKLQKKVKEMVWMAGAVNVPGNTENHMYGHGYSGMNHYAEWNVYGDAFAAQYVLSSAPYPVYMVPLDVCDKIPVCRTDCAAYPDDTCTTDMLSCNFIKIMNRSMPGLPETCPQPLIYQALADAYEKFAAPAPFYRLWDSAATAYVLKPELFLDEGVTELATITDWSYEGWLAQPGEAEAKGLKDLPPYKSVTVFFNLTAPLQKTRNELYEFLATAACGSPYPPLS